MFTHDIGGIHESSNKQDEPHELPKVTHGGTEKSSMVSGLPPSFALVSSTFSVTSWGV